MHVDVLYIIIVCEKEFDVPRAKHKLTTQKPTVCAHFIAISHSANCENCVFKAKF